MKAYTGVEVRTLLESYDRQCRQSDRDNRRNDALVSISVAANQIPKPPTELEDCWHRACEPGPNRAHLKIRIPVWLGFALLRFRL